MTEQQASQEALCRAALRLARATDALDKAMHPEFESNEMGVALPYLFEYDKALEAFRVAEQRAMQSMGGVG